MVGPRLLARRSEGRQPLDAGWRWRRRNADRPLVSQTGAGGASRGFLSGSFSPLPQGQVHQIYWRGWQMDCGSAARWRGCRLAMSWHWGSLDAPCRLPPAFRVSSDRKLLRQFAEILPMLCSEFANINQKQGLQGVLEPKTSSLRACNRACNNATTRMGCGCRCR